MVNNACASDNIDLESGDMSEVFQLIDKIAKNFDKMHRRSIQKVNLTSPQYFILRTLKDTNGVPFKDLASACCCSRPTITGIVDSLEKKGLVTREGNPGDRRSILVKLTDTGATIETEMPSLQSIVENCCPGITQDDLAQLKILLRKLLDSFPRLHQKEHEARGLTIDS